MYIVLWNLDILLDLYTKVHIVKISTSTDAAMHDETLQKSPMRDESHESETDELSASADFVPVGILLSASLNQDCVDDEGNASYNCDDPKDVTYHPSSNSSSASDSDQEIDVPSSPTTNGNQAPNELNSPSKFRRKKPETWKSNVAKRLRLEGQKYVNAKGQEKGKKALGPPCTSSFCEKSKLRSCSALNENERKEIFTRFWGLSSWEARRTFVHASITRQSIKQKKNITSSRRNCSLGYSLKRPDGTAVPVCKKMLCNTLGISKRTIGSWLSIPHNQDIEAEQHSKTTTPRKNKSPMSGKSQPISDHDMAFLKTWLCELPTVESHYCRKTETYKNKKFLLPGTKVTELHTDYCQSATEQDKRAVGLTIFRKMFQSFGFSVFVPKKDQCEKCIQAGLGTLGVESHSAHIQEKNLAREKKNDDKAAAASDNSVSVWTMDLQAVLLCPKTNASSMYYKTKVQVHNMTYFNLNTKEGFCFMWDEVNANLSSEMFAYIHYFQFEEYIKNNPEKKRFIIWSDNCIYQNKNITVSNMFYHLAKKYNVVIEQKFLLKGHTQMECDSMHSTIERNIVCDVFTPSDYAVIFKTARKRPYPYKVKEISYMEPFKLSGAYFPSIRPGKASGDATVNDLKAIRYTPDDIQYKLCHTDEWQILPQRIKNIELDTERLFPNMLKLTKRKHNDVMSMKNVMPVYAQQYFDGLPHD